MQKQLYEDYKYVMQDTSQVYLGVKYTFEEILENEDVPFKFRMIVERYLCEEAGMQTTLESHLYYLPETGLLPKLYRQLKAKVKYMVLEEKKGLLGKSRSEYVTKVVTVEQFTGMSPGEKEKMGVVLQELMFSKLALMTF